MTNAPAAIESYHWVAISTKDFRPWFCLGQAYAQLGLPTYTLYYYQKASYLSNMFSVSNHRKSPLNSYVYLIQNILYEYLKDGR
ncbi:anaphase-promoting complex component apc8 [Stygiomarasmius scandens]|uniref:Anaphase-promoting complex component apc8 n=1 Tax=Marasmiellus scandens TaxID=2682957 RepID=A0ABR1IMT9_9AGAR